MENQLVYYVFVLLLVQSCHVHSQRPLLDVSSSLAQNSVSLKSDSYETLLLGKPSSMSSSGGSRKTLFLGKSSSTSSTSDSNENLLLGKPSHMSSNGGSYETLLLGKPSSTSLTGNSVETLSLGKPHSTSSRGNSYDSLLLGKPNSTRSASNSPETLLLGKPSSTSSKGNSHETLLLGKPSSKGDSHETLLRGKPSSMNSMGDSYDTLLLGESGSRSSKGDLYETLLLGKPSSSTSSKGDSYETLLLGLYIVFVGMMVAKVAFEIVQKVSAVAKASRAEEKHSSKLESMDIEMGIKQENSDSAECKHILYSPEVVKEATQDFSPKSHIRGSSYRGIINGREVIIKQMKGDVSHEMRSLQKVEHENLVKLHGFCMNCEGKSYLIYEHVENGSLNMWLHRPSMGFQGLTWRTRLQIALDVATGLDHIHESNGIVHRDLRSNNVLLNRKLRAKIANFGAAKYIVNSKIEHGVAGASSKIDVFAFGVLLLELISGKEAMIEDGKLRPLWTQIKGLLEGEDREEKLRKWIDPNVKETCSIDSAMSMAFMARACLDEDAEARPSMGEIVYRLSNLLDACFEHLECS